MGVAAPPPQGRGMIDHPTPDVFPASKIGGAGLSDKQARGPGFLTASRGVRRRAESIGDRAVDIDAAVLGCVDDAVVTDLAAARLWGLPLPSGAEIPGADVSVAVRPGRARPKRRGVRGRRLLLPAFHVMDFNGVAVTTPVRTWLDCAELMSFADLVAMGDAILHRGLGHEGEFQHLLQWGYRRRGMAKVRKAVPILDGRAESPGESWARVLLLRGGCPPPRCNVDIYADDMWLARVDMVWPDKRVIVEYDGRVHLEERQRRRDAERLNALQSAGWRVIVLTADDLRRPDQTVRLVQAALSRTR